MNVSRELLPDHPIEKLVACETDPEVGIYNGEVLGFLCLQCKNMDEDISEIIHENDCSLAGHTQPTAYEDRVEGPLGADHAARADGGDENRE